MAVVSDKEWVKQAVAAFGWASPGEIRAFGTDRVEEARGWATTTA
jgi:hypothetical protein